MCFVYNTFGFVALMDCWGIVFPSTSVKLLDFFFIVVHYFLDFFFFFFFLCSCLVGSFLVFSHSVFFILIKKASSCFSALIPKKNE